MTSGSWFATLTQLQRTAAARGRADGKPALGRYNPRPEGVIRRGSATHAVLSVLQEHRGALLTRHRLIWLTGHSRKAVDWALVYVRSRGLVEVIVDGVSGHQRFRLKDGCNVEAQLSTNHSGHASPLNIIASPPTQPAVAEPDRSPTNEHQSS